MNDFTKRRTIGELLHILVGCDVHQEENNWIHSLWEFDSTSNSQSWYLIDHIWVKFSSVWELVLRVSQFHDDQTPKEI